MNLTVKYLSKILVAILLLVNSPLLAQWESFSLPRFGGNIAVIHNSKIYTKGWDFLNISADFGDNWSKTYLETYPNVVQVENGKIYCASCRSLYYFEDDKWNRYDDMGNNYIYTFKIVGKRIIAGDYNNLYISEAWGSKGDSLTTGLNKKNLNSLSFSGKALFIGTARGAYTSSDTGRTWKVIPFLKDFEIMAIQASSSLICIGTVANGVFISRDGGLTWNAINSGLASLSIQKLYYINDDLYIIVDGKLFQLGKDGNSWTRLFFEGTVYDITGENENLVVSTSKLMLLSREQGKTWKTIGIPWEIIKFESDGKNLFCISGYKLFELSQNKKWELWPIVPNGILSSYIDSQNIYIGSGQGVYKWSKDSSKWVSTSSQLNSEIYSIDADGDRVVIDNFRSKESKDGGKSWNIISEGFEEDPQIVDGEIFLVTYDKGIFKLEENGKKLLRAYGKDTSINEFLLSNSFFCYVWTSGSKNGIAYSNDKGLSWKSVNIKFRITNFASFLSEKIIVVSDELGTIYGSLDKGQSWNVLNENFPVKYIDKSYILNNVLYVATSDHNVYYRDISELLTIGETSLSVEKRFKLFPNPAKDRLNYTGPTINKIIVRNLTGIIVLEKNSENIESIDVSVLANGFYIIELLGIKLNAYQKLEITN